jgi:hypothetical protein
LIVTVPSYLSSSHTCHSNRWLVESSRPATSDAAVDRKSSYPSPPDISNSLPEELIFLWFNDCRRSLEKFCGKWPTSVKNRTWPVWPCGTPRQRYGAKKNKKIKHEKLEKTNGRDKRNACRRTYTLLLDNYVVAFYFSI